MNADTLEMMFYLREKFMLTMKEKGRGYQLEWPVDMGDKKTQQLLREITLKGIEEMFESLGELKNWKHHRVTENREVNKDAYIEEIVDAFNYFLAILVLAGVSHEDFYQAYVRKDKIIHERLNNGY